MSTVRFTGLLLGILITLPSAGIEARQKPSSAHPAGAAHRAFVMAVADDDLPQARSLMARALIASLPKLGGLAKVCAGRVGPGKILGVQTVSTEVTGNTAVVSYRFQLADGSSRFGKEPFVLEDGAWKLDVKGAR